MSNSLFKNFSYSFAANILNLLVRTAYVFFLPKLIGVEDFGYWQLYFLYTQFMHFCHMGLVDGVYLKIGGFIYETIKKGKLISQFSVLILFSIAFALLLNAASLLTTDNSNKIFILFIVSLDLLVMLPRTLLSVIFQATAKIRELTLAMLSEVLVSFIIVCLLLMCGIKDYHIIILADFFGRIVSLGVSLALLPEFFYVKLPSKQDFLRSIAYIKIGVFLLMANMAGMLVLSIIRLCIEYKWGIIVFSKISLSFSLSNMVMVGISAGSLVLFPYLKRMSKDKFEKSYVAIKEVLTLFLLFLLTFYYPASKILELWLPKYVDSFRYLAILAPMCLCEAQLSLVYNNYLKAIRKERMIFKINMLTVLLAVFLGALIIIANIQLDIVLFGILLLGITKVTIANYVMNKYFSQQEHFDLVVTVGGMVMFVICNFYIIGLRGTMVYILSIVALGAIFFKKYINNIKFLRNVG